MITWLASYPRSGNTLVRLILYHCFNLHTFSIYNDPYDIGADEQTAGMVGHRNLPEDIPLERIRESGEVYYIKTHEKWKPEFDPDRALYVIRDGREVVVSYYHYLHAFGRGDTSYTRVIGGDSFAGPWDEHVRSWDPKERKNTLLLRYEDLLSNLEESLEEIGRFIGREQVSRDLPSFAQLRRVNPLFFRSGRTDSWREKLSGDDLEYFWYRNAEVMEEYGYGEDIPPHCREGGADDPSFLARILTRELEVRTARFSGTLSNRERTIRRQTERIRVQRQELRSLREQIRQLEGSVSYTLGRFLLAPLRLLRRAMRSVKAPPESDRSPSL